MDLWPLWPLCFHIFTQWWQNHFYKLVLAAPEKSYSFLCLLISSCRKSASMVAELKTAGGQVHTLTASLPRRNNIFWSVLFWPEVKQGFRYETFHRWLPHQGCPDVPFKKRPQTAKVPPRLPVQVISQQACLRISHGFLFHLTSILWNKSYKPLVWCLI